MWKSLLAVGVLLALASGRAEAQPAFAWTGFYIGASGGYGWGKVDNLFTLVPSPVPAVPFDNVTYSDRLDGPIIGGQAGYNRQFNDRWLAGIEADLSYTRFKGSAANSGTIAAGFVFINDQRVAVFLPFSYNQSQEVNWLAT